MNLLLVLSASEPLYPCTGACAIILSLHTGPLHLVPPRVLSSRGGGGGGQGGSFPQTFKLPLMFHAVVIEKFFS